MFYFEGRQAAAVTHALYSQLKKIVTSLFNFTFRKFRLLQIAAYYLMVYEATLCELHNVPLTISLILTITICKCQNNSTTGVYITLLLCLFPFIKFPVHNKLCLMRGLTETYISDLPLYIQSQFLLEKLIFFFVRNLI